MNCSYFLCGVFGSMFCFGDVFESVFDTGDVFGDIIFTCDVFESRLQSDVNIHLVCNLQFGEVNELQLLLVRRV